MLWGFPFQTCGNVCGVIVAILAVVAQKVPNIWQNVILSQTRSLPSGLKWLLDPTTFSDYLREVIISWLVKGKTNVAFIENCVKSSRLPVLKDMEDMQQFVAHPTVGNVVEDNHQSVAHSTVGNIKEDNHQSVAYSTVGNVVEDNRHSVAHSTVGNVVEDNQQSKVGTPILKVKQMQHTVIDPPVQANVKGMEHCITDPHVLEKPEK